MSFGIPEQPNSEIDSFLVNWNIQNLYISSAQIATGTMMEEAIKSALLESIFDDLVNELECHGFARDINDLPSQFAFEFAKRACARINKWTDELPATEGLYWYLQVDGDTGYVELCMAGPFSEEPNDLIVSETTEPLWSIIRNWGITHWCGPLVPPPPDQTYLTSVAPSV